MWPFDGLTSPPIKCPDERVPEGQTSFTLATRQVLIVEQKSKGSLAITEGLERNYRVSVSDFAGAGHLRPLRRLSGAKKQNPNGCELKEIRYEHEDCSDWRNRADRFKGR